MQQTMQFFSFFCKKRQQTDINIFTSVILTLIDKNIAL